MLLYQGLSGEDGGISGLAGSVTDDNYLEEDYLPLRRDIPSSQSTDKRHVPHLLENRLDQVLEKGGRREDASFAWFFALPFPEGMANKYKHIIDT